MKAATDLWHRFNTGFDFVLDELWAVAIVLIVAALVVAVAAAKWGVVLVALKGLVQWAFPG